MAIYHLSTKSVSRSTGRSATASIAYRAGVKIKDERTGKFYDYTKRSGVVEATLQLPAYCKKVNIERNKLWNLAEQEETRKNSRTAREIVVNLPYELSENERSELVNNFAIELAERYKIAVDVAIHKPDSHGDNRNHHAHLLMTTREIELKNGSIILTKKAQLELSNTRLQELDLPTSQQELKNIRKIWADRTNQALERAGLDERIDHRSHKERGLDIKPTIKMGWQANRLERMGISTDVGDINRQIKADNLEIMGLKAEIIAKSKELESIEKSNDVIANFMKSASKIKQKHETERNKLRSSVNALNEQLEEQAKKIKTFSNNLQKLPIFVDWEVDIHKMRRNINFLETQELLQEAKKIAFELDENYQAKDFSKLSERIASIQAQADEDSETIDDTDKINSQLAAEYKQFELSKTFSKELIQLSKQLESTRVSVLYAKEEEFKYITQELSYDFRQINNDDYSRIIDNHAPFYKELADYDTEELARIEREHEKLNKLKANEITTHTQKQLNELKHSFSNYHNKNKAELTELREKNDAVYNELNKLSKQLKEQEEQRKLELDRQAKAEKERQLLQQQQRERQRKLELDRQAKAEKEKQEQQRKLEAAEYQQRKEAFIQSTSNSILEDNYEELQANDSLIDSAKNVALYTAMLEACKVAENLTEYQKLLHDKQIIEARELAESSVDSLKKEIDRLPANKQKIELIEQLSTKLSVERDRQANDEIISELLPHLEQEKKQAQKKMSTANSYRRRP